MAGHLKRGEAYRRRKEYESALKDLRRAADLDPLAPHPREILGDVQRRDGSRLGRGGPVSRVSRSRRSLAAGVVQTRRSRNWRAGSRPPPKRHCVARSSSTIGSPRRITCWAFACTSCSGRPQAVAVARNALESESRTSPGARGAGGGLRPDESRAICRIASSKRSPDSISAGRARSHSHWDTRVTARSIAPCCGFETPSGTSPTTSRPHVTIGRLWLERAEHGGDAELKKALQALEVGDRERIPPARR